MNQLNSVVANINGNVALIGLSLGLPVVHNIGDQVVSGEFVFVPHIGRQTVVEVDITKKILIVRFVQYFLRKT